MQPSVSPLEFPALLQPLHVAVVQSLAIGAVDNSGLHGGRQPTLLSLEVPASQPAKVVVRHVHRRGGFQVPQFHAERQRQAAEPLGRYHGMLEERGKSLVGSWNQLTDDLARTQKAIGDGFTGACDIKKVTADFESGLNAIAKAMERNRAEVSAMIRGGVTFAGVMTGLIANTWALSAAMRGVSVTGITLQASLNPANVLKIAVSLRAVAVGVMDHNLSQAGVSLSTVKDGMDGASSSAGKIQHAMLGNSHAVEVTHARLVALR